MKLLLDEHYDHAISDELRQRGIDAVAVTKERTHLAGQQDDALLRAAAGERRVLLTNNVRARQE